MSLDGYPFAHPTETKDVELAFYSVIFHLSRDKMFPYSETIGGNRLMAVNDRLFSRHFKSGFMSTQFDSEGL